MQSLEAFQFKLGVVDNLVFGSECGDIEILKTIADFLTKESPEYKEQLQNYLKQGLSYPKARANVLEVFFPKLDKKLLSSSNNILAIEYCRALKHFNSSIVPMTITRKDNLYNDEELAENGKLSSATAIRNALLDSSNLFDTVLAHMPENSLNVLKDNWEIAAPVCSNDFSLLLKYKLLLETRETLVQYLDVTSDLADRIYNNLNLYRDFDSFCELLKTKEMTHTRISRSLLHILLDIKKDEYKLYKTSNINNGASPNINNGYGQYARILGFRKEAAPLLREIKNNSSVPLISKLSDSVRDLDDVALSMLQKDIQVSHIYESVVADKFHQEFKNEFKRQLVII